MAAASINEYIAAQPESVQERLRQIHQIITSELKEAEDAIKWGSPAILHPSGMILVMFSAHKYHINVVVTPSAREAVAETLTGFETGKGSLKIPHDAEIPRKQIQAMVREREREYLEEGAKWM